MKICMVVQRYGQEVNGGAEAYARQIAEHLAKRSKHEVHCATTKAIDYVTWANEYDQDEEVLNRVTIHRFPTIAERNQEKFNKFSEKVLLEPTTMEMQEEWMRLQGPESPALVDWVAANEPNFDVFIFVCYLYYTTYFALPKVAHKAIFIPTAHEERPIHLDIFADMFEKPASFYYNTPEEKVLVEKLFASAATKPNNDGAGGVGVELPSKISVSDFKTKYSEYDLSDYIVYVGRIDENKCCNVLFDYFAEYKRRNPSSTLKLVLIGKEIIPVPKRDDIISLGFVDEHDKFAAIKASRFLVLPSRFESLSIVVLEAMALGRSVLINGNCDVLKAHCTRSNAGFYYTDYFEFEALMNLMTSEEFALKMELLGANGLKYIEDYYTWDAIIDGYEALMDEIC